MLILALLLATPLDTQRAFEGCLEVEADRAARAGVEVEPFRDALAELCVEEEEALVATVVAQRASRDPALTQRQAGTQGEQPERAARAAADYATGLRGVVAAGYPTLLQLRGPAPDTRRYPYGGRGDATLDEPVPPALDSPAPISDGTSVPPLGPRGKRITVPSEAAAPASRPTPARVPPPLSPQPKRIRVPQG